jgi:hypothetical protein
MPRRLSPSAAQTEHSIKKCSVPAGAPSWVTSELIAKTLRVWQPYYSERLTEEEALAMILNVAGLREVLSQGAEHETVRRTRSRQ